MEQLLRLFGEDVVGRPEPAHGINVQEVDLTTLAARGVLGRWADDGFHNIEAAIPTIDSIERVFGVDEDKARGIQAYIKAHELAEIEARPTEEEHADFEAGLLAHLRERDHRAYMGALAVYDERRRRDDPFYHEVSGRYPLDAELLKHGYILNFLDPSDEPPIGPRGNDEAHALPFTDWVRGWKEYRRMVKEKYPFVNGKSLRKNWYKPLIYPKIAGLINRLKPASRDSILSGLVGAALDGLEMRYANEATQVKREMLPRLMIWKDFGDGATRIQRLYAVEHNGREFPVYFEADRPPTQPELLGAMQYVRNHGQSPFNKMVFERLQNDPPYPDWNPEIFLNGEFTAKALELYCRGDFERYFQDEPRQFKKWLVRDDTYRIHQKGERDTAQENAFGIPDLRVYKRPGKLDMFLYWLVGNYVYDGIDVLFDPIQGMLEGLGVDKPYMRRVIGGEYKAITNAIRGMFPDRQPRLSYD